MVKQFMREQAHGRESPWDLPVMGRPTGMTLRLIGRIVRPETLRRSPPTARPQRHLVGS